MRRNAAFSFLLVLLLALPAAGAVDLGYSCPPVLVDDDGTELALVERRDGVWRVGEPVPFVLQLGRFWRFVCAYAAPGGPEVEAVLHWVELPRRDGEPLFEDLCLDPPAEADAGGEGLFTSLTRQATVRLDAPATAARARLAVALLAAAEAVALPCSGVDDAPPLCVLWEVEEMHEEGTATCTWTLADEEPDDGFRYSYHTRCLLAGSELRGQLTRVGGDTFERTGRRGFQEGTRFFYRGDFRQEPVEGVGSWAVAQAEATRSVRFVAWCAEWRDAAQ